jgi:hypothetical protein
LIAAVAASPIKELGMTEGDKRNERLKLASNWMNAVATGVWTVGAFIPVAQYVYGLLPAGVDNALIYGQGASCVGLGILIHLLGQWILGYLE